MTATSTLMLRRPIATISDSKDIDVVSQQSDVGTSSFVTGAHSELSVALVKGNEVVYREALHVYATVGGTAARVGATVATVDPE
jgi:predicted acyltransferase (DUF342 family)